MCIKGACTIFKAFFCIVSYLYLTGETTFQTDEKKQYKS